jgi:KDO2-lipid IV(A) lauroyltransferase
MNFWANLFGISLAFFFRLFPRRLRWYFGVALAAFWFDVLRFRRFTVLKNITIAFPELSHSERLRIARQSMQYLCYGFFEFTQMPFLDQHWLKTQVVFHGTEIYDKAQSQGKGVLLLSLHLGNGDLGLAALALKGYTVNAISKKFKNAFFNQLWFGVREKLGTRFLEPHGSHLAFDILKACRAKESVLFVTDQFMGKPYGIESTFFRKKTGTAYGLALFAAKTKAPVVPVYTYRDAQLRTHLEFGPVIDFEVNEDKDLQIQRMTQKYNDCLQAIVEVHPEQWMWLHRRWKKWE